MSLQLNKAFYLLKHLKYENIATLIGIVLSIMSLYTHIKLNGFYDMLGFEVLTDTMFTLLFRYIVKDIRKNPKEYISIFFD